MKTQRTVDGVLARRPQPHLGPKPSSRDGQQTSSPIKRLHRHPSCFPFLNTACSTDTGRRPCMHRCGMLSDSLYAFSWMLDSAPLSILLCQKATALELPCKQNGHWRGRPNPVIDPSHFESRCNQARQVRLCTRNLLRPVLSEQALFSVTGCGLLCSSFLRLCPNKHLESRRNWRGWSLPSTPAGLFELVHA